MCEEPLKYLLLYQPALPSAINQVAAFNWNVDPHALSYGAPTFVFRFNFEPGVRRRAQFMHSFIRALFYGDAVIQSVDDSDR